MHDDVENVFCSRWIQNVKSILDRSGFGECWDNQEILNVTWFKRAIDLRLKDIDRQDWLNDVNENGQCLNYRIFKDSLAFEPYLVKCDSRNLCKFRCGSHRLPSISGRYEGIVLV